MATPNALEVCRTDLFTKELELLERYPQAVVDKVLRVREMYQWFIDSVCEATVSKWEKYLELPAPKS